ncbi:MAG: hypothetical protein ACREBF_01455 [Candidatus Micrarchaeales archaeon]
MQLVDFAYSKAQIGLIFEQKPELFGFYISKEMLQLKFSEAFVYGAVFWLSALSESGSMDPCKSGPELVELTFW